MNDNGINIKCPICGKQLKVINSQENIDYVCSCGYGKEKLNESRISDAKVTKNTKIYKFTEEELVSLQNRCKSYGFNKALDYIGFCYNNYIWRQNYRGLVLWARDLVHFVNHRDYIPNHRSLSFDDYLEEYK